MNEQKAACRERYIHGESLRSIAESTGIPGGTLRTWAWKERWSEDRRIIRQRRREQQWAEKEAARAKARERYQRARDLYHKTNNPVSYIARVTDNKYWTVVDWIRREGWQRPGKTNGG